MSDKSFQYLTLAKANLAQKLKILVLEKNFFLTNFAYELPKKNYVSMIGMNLPPLYPPNMPASA